MCLVEVAHGFIVTMRISCICAMNANCLAGKFERIPAENRMRTSLECAPKSPHLFDKAKELEENEMTLILAVLGMAH